MVQEIIEEVIWVFAKNVAQNIGVAIRSIWFRRKYSIEEITKSKWNVRMGWVVLFLIVNTIIMFFF
jgi:hypothetical protein